MGECGAYFTFVNSSGTPPDRSPSVEPDSGPRPFAWHGTGEVIVADDEIGVLTVTARALERIGLTVTRCEDGEAAVAVFKADPERWRLVLLDLSMPRLNGAQALTAMRLLRPELPAVLSSGYSESEMRDTVPDAKGIVFLLKPFTVRSLSEAVRQVLGE
ncbi:MAG: response regulator [Gemmatimonadetes bacterium]|nr:response regulator [Gemmatimonadota bacterium]